jgi:hypothetical protein
MKGEVISKGGMISKGGSISKVWQGFGVLWTTLVIPLLPAACAPEEIVIATVEHDAAARADRPCSRNTDCHNGEECARPGCEQIGVCQGRPPLCADSGPICGCDGVTYWNDCLRLQHDVPAASPGPCHQQGASSEADAGVAATCSDPSAQECPVPGAFCARLLSPPDETCAQNVNAPGRCWILPAGNCPPSAPSDPTWISCADASLCEDPCTAIRSGVAHWPAASPCR